ncbi:unnamed protein product [Coregonus sp. 'balchen']|nr:unnamed protein product [Coregonus sp. 'balchen']
MFSPPPGFRVGGPGLVRGPPGGGGHRGIHCENKLTQCVRVPALKTYFFETPYETVIDVGSCSCWKCSPGNRRGQMSGRLHHRKTLSSQEPL